MNILILFISLALIFGSACLVSLINTIDYVWLRLAAFIAVNYLNGFIAYAAMKGMKRKAEIDLTNKRQYLAGCCIGLALALLIAVIPALCGYSLIGMHRDWSWVEVLFQLLFCMLVVGPVEEFIFRVYLQELFVSCLPRNKWIGGVLAALLFGLLHLINGNLIQVLFAFGIGLIFGFSKYKLKNCGFVGVAVAHGLYDFLIVITRMLLL